MSCDIERQLAFDQMLQFLQAQTENFKCEKKREELSAMDLSIMCQLLCAHNSELSMYPPSSKAHNSIQLITHTYRCLRNSCVACARNQQLIRQSSPVLIREAVNCLFTISLLLKMRQESGGAETLVLQHVTSADLLQALLVGSQFLGNYYSSNEPAVDSLWCGDDGMSIAGCDLLCLIGDLVSHHDTHGDCHGVVTGKLRYTAAMLLYNLLRSPLTMENVLSDPEMAGCISLLLQLSVTDNMEWGFLLTSDLFQKASYLYKCFRVLPCDVRCHLLDILCHHLPQPSSPSPAGAGESEAVSVDDSAGGGTVHILPSPQCVQVMMDTLVDTVCHNTSSNTSPLTQHIMSADDEESAADVQGSADEERFQHSLLAALCALSSRPDLTGDMLRDSHELMELVTDMLLVTDLSERDVDAHISDTLQNISLDAPPPSEQQQPESASRKQLLIRLLANLAFRRPPNQDMVREKQVLPIILDSCQLSARDPFLREWCVYAIRNLCEGNAENQRYISAMRPLPQPTSASSPAPPHQHHYITDHQDVYDLFK